MIKDFFIKIDKFMDSKGFLLLLLFLLLVITLIAMSLSCTNEKLEQQIIERDNHIRNLQYTDSIARQFLDIESTDSTQIFSYIAVDGEALTYNDLLQDRKNYQEQLNEMVSEIIRLQKELKQKKAIIDLAQKTCDFKYSITERNDSVFVSLWQE